MQTPLFVLGVSTTFADALVQFTFPRGTVVLLDENAAFHHYT